MKIPKEVIEFRDSLEKQPAKSELVEFENLSVEALVIAIYLVKNYQIRGTKTFKPIDSTEVTLVPNQQLCHYSVLKLIPETSVRLSRSNSPEDLFQFQYNYGELFFYQLSNNQPDSLPYIDSISFCMRHLKWICNLEIERITRFISKDKFGPILNSYQNSHLLGYWKQLAIDECIEYLEIRSKLITDSPIIPQFELIKQLELLLDSFSVAQIINMIWSSMNFCLGLISDKGGTLQQLFPKSFIKYSNLAIENGWAISTYEKRLHSNSRSELHKIFFEDLLNYKKDPFGLVISDENLRNIIG